MRRCRRSKRSSTSRCAVLDHGFVRVVDYMGDDAAVVQAARVSYGRGTRRVSEDQGLINYLMRHRHTTPFEMCEIKYPCQTADLCRPAMDPPSHRQRQRILGTLFDPRQRILYSGADIWRRRLQLTDKVAAKPIEGGDGAARARFAARGCRARLCQLCRTA